MAKIAIIGAGLVGRGWAISFARAGLEVCLWDKVPGAAAGVREFATGVLGDLARSELLNGQAPEAILGRISSVEKIEAALEGAVHVQENTPEVLESKMAVFAELGRLAPKDAVIASSTSGLLPSRFTEHVEGRERCLVAHPINPPYLVPAVEVVPAPWTSADAIEQTRALLVSAGHAPMVMKRELDGFIMNRMQGALLEEAFRLVADGYASVEDVDTGIREGIALRWSFMGPFETIDLNAPMGVRDYAERYEGMYANITETTRHRADWTGKAMEMIEGERRKRLPADQLKARALWRDRRLMALAAHKKRSDTEFGK